ncbi:MAG: PfkB family carbohydrate kinase [Candidatus Nealsonbacteria bacterium]|nr:PfkB family carbohydrate kinase [Candidatus Nealsonbacteria bacterium]
MSDLINQKIKNIDELAEIVAKLKNEGKKVVQCHGVFELVHPGHLYHFESAKKEGDVLIISITADEFVNKGPGRPIFSAAVRAKSLANIQIVDYVIINHDFSAIELLKKIKPNIYFKDQEYKSALQDPNRNLYKEAQAVRSVGGEIKFSYEPTFSSSNFLKNYFDIYPQEVKNFLKDFNARYSAKEIIDILKSLREMKILLIGETIIDEYHYCRGMGKIPKDNLIATKYLNNEIFAGGVLACANHLAGFCDNVHLVTTLGKKNSYEDFIKLKLKPNITFKFFYDDEGQTIVKKRFIDPIFFNKMFEIYYFDDRQLSVNISEQIIDYLINILPRYDLVIVNDYGHGFFDKNIIATLTEKAKFLAVNTQTNSANTGFNLITKYSRSDYVCIDEPEARLATHQKDGDISEVIAQIFKMINVKKMVVTRGHLGSIASEGANKTYNVPVLSTRVVDRVGAGDAFLAISSPCAAKGAPMEIVSFIGNVIGAIKVTVVGNKSSVMPDQVYRFIQTLFK